MIFGDGLWRLSLESVVGAVVLVGRRGGRWSGRRRRTSEMVLGDSPRRRSSETVLGDGPRRRSSETVLGDGPRRRSSESVLGDGPRRRSSETVVGDNRRRWSLETVGDLTHFSPPAYRINSVQRLQNHPSLQRLWSLRQTELLQ